MNEQDIVQVVRLVAVMALVCVAASLATPKGRIPLALRGLAKLLQGCKVAEFQGSSTLQPCNPGTLKPSAWKRGFAFLLVILAILLALI